MTKLEQALKRIDSKLRLLKFTRDNVPRIQEKNELKAAERLQKGLEQQIDSVHEQMVEIEALKIENGEQPDDVRKWSVQVEKQVAEYEQVSEGVKRMVKCPRDEALLEAKWEEKVEEEKRKRRFEEELKLEEARMEIKREFEKKLEEDKSKSAKESGAKLPKLTITKFQGTHLDWLRFWNQFETEINKAAINQVAKFSYLKELLIPRIRSVVDGLPYNTEGYECAKAILKAKYGRPSEVANTHMQCIIALPTIQGSQPLRIHEFYEKLSSNIQALDMMGKLREINSYVQVTLEKLPGIRADLVHLDDDWQEWTFTQMLEALCKWCCRNPLHLSDQPVKSQDRFFNSRQEDWKQRPCEYCGSAEHKSVDCSKVVSVAERKKHLSEKRLCFNCTGTRHRAVECRTTRSCQKCNGRHHTSICDREHPQFLLTTYEDVVIYPVVVVNVDGIKCRTLLDMGAGSAYASAVLIKHLGKQPSRTEHKRIDMMMCSTTQKIEQYEVKISNTRGKFEITTVSKVDKGVLLSIPNPQYNDKIKMFPHLAGVTMDDEDMKPERPTSCCLHVA